MKEEDEGSIKSWFVPFTTTKAITFIILIGLSVYFNVFFNGFVWDDKSYIINYPQVHSVDLINSFKPNLFNTGSQYRPIPVVYFSTLYSLFNTQPFFYHFLQILIHIVNSVILFLILKHFFSKAPSFLLSLVFLVHPINVESVAYIGASGNPLFFLFGSVALLTSLKKKLDFRIVPLVSFFLLLALLTKETAILFALIILTYTYIFKKKWLLMQFIATIGSIAAYALIRFGIGGIFFEKLELTSVARLTFIQRLANIPAVVFYYLKTFLYPDKLSIGQDWIIKEITFESFYLSIIIEIILLFLLFYIVTFLYIKRRKGFKVFIFFLVWFLGGLILHSQIVALDWTVADRWFYFTLAGLAGVTGIILENFTPKKMKILTTIILALVIGLLSIRTIERNPNWKDAITLYEHDTKIYQTWDLENNLGAEYKYIGNQEKALEHYLYSVDIFPFETNLLNVGIVYGNLGNTIKAMEYFYKAYNAKSYARGHKRSLITYQNLVQTLLISKEPEKAEAILEEAVADYPESSVMWVLVAITKQRLDKDTDASSAAKRALELQNDDLSGYIYKKIQDNSKIEIIPEINSVKFL